MELMGISHRLNRISGRPKPASGNDWGEMHFIVHVGLRRLLSTVDVPHQHNLPLKPRPLFGSGHCDRDVTRRDPGRPPFRPLFLDATPALPGRARG
jgi:hypothetical protein